MRDGIILVTGSGGFNGRVVLEMLKEQGYKVRATDLEFGERTASRDYYDKLGVEFIASDLTKPETLPKVLEGVTAIMHTASLFDYSATLEENNKINVDGGRNLMEAAVKAGVKKCVLWGTIGVYGEQSKMPVTEENPPNPGNDYEISKLAQEKLYFEYSSAGKMVVTCMRPAPVYGPRNKYGFINIIKIAIIAHVVPVPEKLDVRLPSVHVIDVARAGIFLLEAADDKVNGQSYTLIDDSCIPVSDFLHLVAGLLGKPTFPIKIPLNKNILLELGHWAAKFSKLGADFITHNRPFLEDATVGYMKYNYIFSNQKLKDLGFTFAYPDCRIGLIEMTDWIKAENYEPLKIVF